MEAEIQQAFPKAIIELIKGGGGIFDIHLRGEILYSKKTMHGGRFPQKGQIVQLIRDASS